jgi:hypothetical protein
MPSRLHLPLPVAVALLLSIAAATGRASQVERSTETQSPRYVIPQGDVGRLVEFIQRLSVYRPKTVEEDIKHRRNFQPTLKQAAEKIVGLESDQTSSAYEVAQFVLLTGRIRSLAQAVRAEQEKTLADVKNYVGQRIAKGQGSVAANVAQLAVKTCQATGQYDLAAATYRGLGEELENCDDQNVSNQGRTMRATADRLVVRSKDLPQSSAAAKLPAANSLVPLDLQAQGNLNLWDTAGTGNGLAELQLGEQTIGGVRFQVGDRVIKPKPEKESKVEGIPVKRKIARLWVLHATEYGSPRSVADGTPIGQYRVRFDDGSDESVPIVYGKDVRDWWDFDDGTPVTRGRVVWTGGNFTAGQRNVTIRLYLGVWENPRPEKMVDALDYISSTDTRCSPFCVAMTVEEPGGE